MEHIWKKLESNVIVNDIAQYVQEFCESNPDTKIYLGCDSQNRKHITIFGIVIVLHKKSRGGHVLFTNIKTPRIKDKWERLFKEAHMSLEVAEYLKSKNVQKVDSIDLDLNPDPKFGSNAVIRAAMGYVESMGYTPRIKPNAPAASYAADKI